MPGFTEKPGDPAGEVGLQRGAVRDSVADRVGDAQSQLLDPRRAVGDVMLDAGFQTKSNFNREFRRVTGDSPSGWRRKQAAVGSR